MSNGKVELVSLCDMMLKRQGGEQVRFCSIVFDSSDRHISFNSFVADPGAESAENCDRDLLTSVDSDAARRQWPAQLDSAAVGKVLESDAWKRPRNRPGMAPERWS